jgi:hypothetical protein
MDEADGRRDRSRIGSQSDDASACVGGDGVVAIDDQIAVRDGDAKGASRLLCAGLLSGSEQESAER